MFGLFESKQEKIEKLLKKGMASMGSGQFSAAESCFLKAIELDIFNAADAWIGLGALYFSTENIEKAKSCFETAMGQRRDDYHAIRGMALVERKLGNDEHAAELFRQLQDKFQYKSEEDPTLSTQDRVWLKSLNV